MGLAVLALVSAPLAVRAQSASSSASTPTTSSSAPRAEAIAPLAQRIDLALRTAHLPGAHVGIAVIDAGSGRELFARHATDAFNPASNTKIVTAAAALALLGPDRTFTTTLRARVDGHIVRDGLVLRGGGDPSLSTGDVFELAHQLAARGVDRIEGGIVVDDRLYGREQLPPAFEQQPRENAPFRASVSAASVDENVITLHVTPGAREGDAAHVFAEPEGYVELDGAVGTSASGRANVAFDSVAIAGGRERVRVGGTLPVSAGHVVYRRRLENPSLAAGFVLASALRAAGIRVNGGVRVDPTIADRPTVASHDSEPLSALLYRLGKDSDNFYAEMTLLAIGADDHPATMSFAHAIERVTAWLATAGISTTGLQLRNGSGLFDANRMSPAQLVSVLRTAWRDPGIRNEYVAQLSVAGDDGTLAHRIDVRGADRWVRAKTGTLDDAIALSGYVLSDDPGRTLAFSVLLEGVHGRHAEARRLADTIARELVREQQQAPAP